MNGISFEDAKRNLLTWTSATAQALLAGIERLEALVEELKAGLATVRRERNEAMESHRTLRKELDQAERKIQNLTCEADHLRESNQALIEVARQQQAKADTLGGELKRSRASRDAEWLLLEQAQTLDLANKAIERLSESRDTIRDQNRKATAALREVLNPDMPADMPLANLAVGVVALVEAHRDTEKRLLTKNAELYEETLRLRNELNAEQSIELVLVDRKGFERKISMRRKDAGPTILVPGPSGERISFRFQYGNIYKEMW